MITINMLSKADIVKGHGVLSAHDEQVDLIRQSLSGSFEVFEDKWKCCDITHFHTINPTLLFRLPLAKLHGKTVGHVHFLPETLENSIHLPWLFKVIFYKYLLFFYKRMDYLVTVNPYFIDILAGYGVDKKRVSYIPNYVSEKNFYLLPKSTKAQLRTAYNLDPNKFTALCVGQLQKRKGIIDFIEVAKMMPDIQFVWAGDFVFGKISDGYEQIKIIKNEAPDNVHFLGLIERGKMNELYNLSDVMFLPSLEELFPMTVLESMNCKIPILLRDLAEYKGILFNFYLKGQTIQEFRKTLQRLQTDSEFYQMAVEMSEKGRNFYSREHVADLWKQFYETVHTSGQVRVHLHESIQK